MMNLSRRAQASAVAAYAKRFASPVAAANGVERTAAGVTGYSLLPPNRAGVDALLAGMEELAGRHVDPEQFRWRRSLAELGGLHAIVTGPQWARAVSTMSSSLLALRAPSAQPLLDHVVDHFASSIEGLEVDDCAVIALALALTRLANPRAAATAPAFEHARGSVEAATSTLPNVLTLSASVTVNGAGESVDDAARAVFWDRLVPHALSLGHAWPTSSGAVAAAATVLLAIAVARHTLPGPLKCSEIEPAMDATITACLADAGFWRCSTMSVDTVMAARLIGALGLLTERSPMGCGTLISHGPIAERVARLFDIERFHGADLSSLLLLGLGLRGLGLVNTGNVEGTSPASRLSRDLDNRIAQAIAGGTGGLTPRDACNALLLLQACGRLTLSEPGVFPIVRAAADAVDILQRSERRALRALLTDLFVDLGRSTAPASNGSHSFPAASPEASICALERYDWFGRRPRSQVSWLRSRGRSS